jgi:hypothetical protein
MRGRETAGAVLVIAFPPRADDRRWLVIDGKAGGRMRKSSSLACPFTEGKTDKGRRKA